jgi:iron complex transport system ATP-binding protein
LAATGTAALETRTFGSLSGGEKQRVVIAGALAQASELLLLDEPTAALDLAYQFEIASLLRRLNADRGTTMIVSTHDLNFAAAVCDRIILLKQGRVMAQGSTTDILTADNVRLLYGVEADVQFHPRAGHVTVVPIARSH